MYNKYNADKTLVMLKDKPNKFRITEKNYKVDWRILCDGTVEVKDILGNLSKISIEDLMRIYNTGMSLGRLEQLYNKITDVKTVKQDKKKSNWHTGEYRASKLKLWAVKIKNKQNSIYEVYRELDGQLIYLKSVDKE